MSRQELPGQPASHALSDEGVILALCVPGRCHVVGHGGLCREISGVRQMVVPRPLCSLDRDGLVAREVTPAAPVWVECELTGHVGWSQCRLLRDEGLGRDPHLGGPRGPPAT